jgi:hypothetical protein
VGRFDYPLQSRFAKALDVMWAFNDVPARGGVYRRQALLSHDKRQIREALIFIWRTINDSDGRTWLETLGPPNSDVFLSKEFQTGIYVALDTLPEFLPEPEAALRDRVQRRLGWVASEDGEYRHAGSAEDQKRMFFEMLGDPVGLAEHDALRAIERRTEDEREANWRDTEAFSLY